MKISNMCIENYRAYLKNEEKASATIEKYIRDVERFAQFVLEMEISKEHVVAYKRYLLNQQYSTRSINSMLASINGFLRFLGLADYCVKQIRSQREIFCPEEKELSLDEYLRLLDATLDKPLINVIMQTICSTGIRVSELQYFTVESVCHGSITVSCKGKMRTVIIPEKLREKLLLYAQSQEIHTGYIFVTGKGTPIDRSYIWALMKKACNKAGVDPKKVFPHNLRKLFARSFYSSEKDIAKLADILGHSSIETTRIYIITSGQEHRKIIEQLNLVI